MRLGTIAVGVWCLVLATPVGVSAQSYLDPDVTTGTFVVGGDEIGFQRCGGALANTCNYDWWYGCSPTSAGMMMGHYDRNGYDGVSYGYLVPGGVAEANSYGGGGGLDSNGDPIPDLLCNKAIASAGHIADFWTGYGNSGDDPLASGRTIPDDFDSLADFMGTSQDACDNSDGSTTFYFLTDGSPFHDYHAENYNLEDLDGMYGIGEYVDYAGYDTVELFTQLLPHAFGDYYGNTEGFMLDDFKAEIDAGRPVLIHIEGHTMFGYGYDDVITDRIYVYDTWDPNGQHPGYMSWGGTYSGAYQWGVTCLELVPEPGSLALLAVGLMAVMRRRVA